MTRTLIKLVNMPFGALRMPSVALTQLAAVLAGQLGRRVEVEIVYVNLDFGRFLGPALYDYVALAGAANTAGLGDWLFKPHAFTEAKDDVAAYFARFFPQRGKEFDILRRRLLAARAAIGGALDRALRAHRLDEAEIVGFTSMFSQTVPSLALAGRIRRANPSAVIVLGGANCEPPMGPVLLTNCDGLDYVFSGPALRSFPEFVARFLDGDFSGMAAVPGVVARGSAATVRPAEAPLGPELAIDETPRLVYGPFLDALASAFPGGEIQPVLPFETSRGCWWGERAHCTFCGLNGQTMAFRTMSADRAVRQFEELFAYSDRVGMFECVDNIMPVDYPETVLSRLAPPPGKPIFYEVKANLTDDELGRMAKGGVRLIQPGIEALATSTLKLMRKGSTAFQNLVLLKNCLKHDIRPIWNLLVGFPGEPAEVYDAYLRLIPLLHHLPPPTGVFPVRFDRFSPYFNNAADYGLTLEPMDFYRMIYPFDDSALRDIAYYFTDANIDAAYRLDLAPYLAPLTAAVKGWQDAWRDGDALPKLHLDATGTALIDSRGGTKRRHPLSRAEAAVLVAATTRAEPARLISQLADNWSAEALEAALARLDSLDAFFHEGKRLMSLVLDRRPPAPVYLRDMVPGNALRDIAVEARRRLPPDPEVPRFRRLDVASPAGSA